MVVKYFNWSKEIKLLKDFFILKIKEIMLI